MGSFLNGGGITDWTVGAPTHYVLMKVLWNPELDVDAAWDGMYQRQFGEAPGIANRLLQLAANRWENTPWSIEKRGGMDGYMGYLEPSIYRETWPERCGRQDDFAVAEGHDELKDDPAAATSVQ